VGVLVQASDLVSKALVLLLKFAIGLLQPLHMTAKQIYIEDQLGDGDILVCHTLGYTILPNIAPVQNLHIPAILFILL
jgi:hypothetical protein